MSSSSSVNSDGTLTMNTLIHMITIKLSSSNYLLWKNQKIPLLVFQNLLHHVDGSTTAPAAQVFQAEKPTPNLLYAAWISDDRRTILILYASLSEEAFAEVLGLPDARQIWLALENAYSNKSIEIVQNLSDQLRQTVKANLSVTDFGRKFKLICDQLAAVGQFVYEQDKLHWFLRGLDTSFETFSTAVRASKPPSVFRDLLVQAESHEIFLLSLHSTSVPPVAFSAETSRTEPRNRC